MTLRFIANAMLDYDINPERRQALPGPAAAPVNVAKAEASAIVNSMNPAPLTHNPSEIVSHPFG
jgi:hypothetical protein